MFHIINKTTCCSFLFLFFFSVLFLLCFHSGQKVVTSWSGPIVHARSIIFLLMCERGIILLVFHLIETYSTLLFRSSLCKKKKKKLHVPFVLLATHTHTHRSVRWVGQRAEKRVRTKIISSQVKNNKCPCPFSTIFLFHQVSSFESQKKMHCTKEIYDNQNLYKSICVSFEMHYRLLEQNKNT